MKTTNKDLIVHKNRPGATAYGKEIWVVSKPKRGDHIRVKRGIYYHHGIYINNDDVIHFAGENSDNLSGTDNTIHSTTLMKFLKDEICEVRHYLRYEKPLLRLPDEIESFARRCIGKSGYNFFENNCEHFAYLCTLRKHESKQVDNLIEGISNGVLLLSEIKNILDGDDIFSQTSGLLLKKKKLKTEIKDNLFSAYENFLNDDLFVKLKLVRSLGRFL